MDKKNRKIFRRKRRMLKTKKGLIFFLEKPAQRIPAG